MQATLLRQANRSLCFACPRFRFHRLYSSQALAYAHTSSHDAQPVEESQVEIKQDVVKQQDSHKPKKSRKRAKKDAVEELEEPRRNPLEPNKVDIYLASIRAAGLEPTLEDIERCRPSGYGHPESPQYVEDYNALVDSLCRSFSKDQLRRFGELYGLDPVWTRSTRRKVEYAESIIEKEWKWPSLKEIERRKRDRTEVSVQTFNVNPSQLFLILGKDGADLLQLSMEFNVHISLTPNPLGLRVEGLRGSLKALAERVTTLKKHVVEETIELPTKSPIRQDLVQRISRLVGAFIENIGHKGKVRICAKDERSLMNAKRLTIRAAYEVQNLSHTRLLSYIPVELPSLTPVPTSLFPHSYSMYPFLSPRPLPWTMNTSGAFRIRRVAEWLGVDPNEDLSRTGGLAAGRGRISNFAGETRELRDFLRDNLPEPSLSISTRAVTASLGHVLLTSSTTAQRASLVPPLIGSWTFSKLFKWLENDEARRAFVPSLPVAMLRSPPPQQKILHRLIYRVLPAQTQTLESPPASTTPPVAKVIKLEVLLSQAKPATNSSRVEHSDHSADVATSETHVQTEESTSISDNQDTAKAIETSLQDHSEDSSQVEPIPATCSCGTESTLNVVMPDRPMDIHLSVFDFSIMAHDEQPTELQNYIYDLRAFLSYQDPDATQPDPPLSLQHDGQTYILHTNVSVRQGTESAPALGGGTEVLTESILDLESNEKSTHCEVVCHDLTDENKWKELLRHCDRLTSITFKSLAGAAEGEGDQVD